MLSKREEVQEALVVERRRRAQLQAAVDVAQAVISSCETRIREFDEPRVRTSSILDRLQSLLADTQRLATQMAERLEWLNGITAGRVPNIHDLHQAISVEEITRVLFESRAQQQEIRTESQEMRDSAKRAHQITDSVVVVASVVAGSKACSGLLSNRAAGPRVLVSAAVAAASCYAAWCTFRALSRPLRERYKLLYESLSAICDGYERLIESWQGVLDYLEPPAQQNRSVEALRSWSCLGQQLRDTATLAISLTGDLQSKQQRMSALDRPARFAETFRRLKQDADLVAEQLVLLSDDRLFEQAPSDERLSRGTVAYCARLCEYATQLVLQEPDVAGPPPDLAPGIEYHQLLAATLPVSLVIAFDERKTAGYCAPVTELTMYIALGALIPLATPSDYFSTTELLERIEAVPLAEGSCWSTQSWQAELAKSVQLQLSAVLSPLLKRKRPTRFVLTGHSIGGAIAALQHLLGTLPAYATHVVTFGALAAVQCSDNLDDLVHRHEPLLANIHHFVHVHDVVPKLFCGSSDIRFLRNSSTALTGPQFDALVHGNKFTHVGQVMLIVSKGDVRRWVKGPRRSSNRPQLHKMLSLSVLLILSPILDVHSMQCYRDALAYW